MSARCRWTVGTIGWIVGMACAGIASAQAPPAPLPEPDGVPKNRFISFSFPESPEGTQWAVRVTLVKMYNTNPADTENEACPPRPQQWFGRELPDLSDFDGEIRWVAPPVNFPEGAFSSDPIRWIGASLRCCPDFRNWTSDMIAVCAPRCLGGGCAFSDTPSPDCDTDDDCSPPKTCDTMVLHVFGPEIVPCSQYEVQLVDVTCPDLEDEACYSDALTVHTAKWGDVWAPLGGESQPTFTDIGKAVDKFKAILPPTKIQILLAGNIPSVQTDVSFSQIGRAVDGFKSIAYIEDGPSECVDPCD